MEISIRDLTKQARLSLKNNWIKAIIPSVVLMVLTGGTAYVNNIGGLITFIITGPLLLGYTKLILNLSRGNEAEVTEIFDGFNDFTRGLFTFAIISFFTTLWTMLFIIPGIIKGISYSQAFFILQDKPNIQPMQAIELSMKMMDGYKMDYFKLNLWFMLLGIICIATLGIGFIFLVPYMYVSYAKFYDKVKDDKFNPTINFNSTPDKNI